MKCSNCRNLRCQKTVTDTDTGMLSRIGPGKQYTLHVNWPGFKGLRHFTKRHKIYNTAHESKDEIQLLAIYTSSNRWCFKSLLKMSIDPAHLICSGN